jgi:hypothetical protein
LVSLIAHAPPDRPWCRDKDRPDYTIYSGGSVT